jgi:hypothetical protein
VVEKRAEEMDEKETWAVYFRYINDKGKRGKINEIMELEEGIAMAGEVLRSISKDEVKRARLMSEYKYQLDAQSKLVHAKRMGIQEGIQQGMQQGRQEIINLLKSGKSPEEIIQLTGNN